MVVDSSAIVAILLDEPGAPAIRKAIQADLRCQISMASVLEVSITMGRRKKVSMDESIDALLDYLEIESQPIDAEQLRLARRAFQLFGKGRHPAGLNFGDCFSYALARCKSEALLFVGTDFSRTDIPAVPW